MSFINHSRVKAYRRCPKLFYYKYVRNLQRKKVAMPLLRGTILHEMLDRRAWMTLSAPKSEPRTPADVLKEYAKKFKTLFIEERETYGDNFIEDIDRVYEGYEKLYQNESLTYESSEEGVQTDIAKDLRFVGTIDKRVIDKDGRRWILDHKTHKTIPGEEARFSDLQLVFYVWAWNREHPERPVDGIIWDYLRTKPPVVPEQLKKGGLSQRADMDTDYETYAGELKRLKLDPAPYAEFLEKLRKRSTDRFYLRIRLPKPSAVMVDQVVEELRQTAVIITRLRVYPRNLTNQCSWCEYYRLCHAELRGLDAKFVAKADFEEREADNYELEEE